MVLRRGGSVVLVLAAIVVIAAGIKLAAPLLNQLVLAGFIATMTAPLVHALIRRRVPVYVAVAAGILVDLAVVGGLGVVVGGSVRAFGEQLPLYQERVELLGAGVVRDLAVYGIDVSLDGLREVVDSGAIVNMIRSLVQSLASLVSSVLMVLLLVAFMLIEAVDLELKLSRVVNDRSDLRELREGVGEVHKYLLVKTATSGATGVLLAGWCWLCGVDLPLLWGLLAFLLNYIPTVGSIIAAGPPMALALVQHGLGTSLAVGAGFLAVNFAIGNMLEPRWMGRALGLSPLVVFLSMIVWGWLLGPVGALFSAPLTMMLKHWVAHTSDFAWLGALLGPADQA